MKGVVYKTLSNVPYLQNKEKVDKLLFRLFSILMRKIITLCKENC